MLLSSCAASALAQPPARVSLDSVVAIDTFRGQGVTTQRPNIIVDISGVVRLGNGWLMYVRPWMRQPREPEWETEIYQAAVQYERPGRISTRIDAGYIASPVGLGMMDTRPGVNPTITPHLSYFASMPSFETGVPRVQPIAATYPLGGMLTLSTTKWDARAAVVSSAPTRGFEINNETNPRATPVLEGGAGVTPTPGLRLGVSFARGDYATAKELSAPAVGTRGLMLVAAEGEYAFRYTKVSGELARTAFETALASQTGYEWFVQGVQTLSPRWFVAARHEGTSAPPTATGVSATRPVFRATEATAGFRLSPDFTLRTSFVARKPFTRTSSAKQVGVSLVWAHRWY